MKNRAPIAPPPPLLVLLLELLCKLLVLGDFWVQTLVKSLKDSLMATGSGTSLIFVAGFFVVSAIQLRNEGTEV